MKKVLALLLTFLFACSMTACAGQRQETGSDSASVTDTPVSGESTGVSEPEEEQIPPNEPGTEQTATDEPETPDSQAAPESSGTESSNILIVSFSRWGNTEYPGDVDATTSASIIEDGNGRYGTTEYVANLIQQTMGGDIHRIETVEPYTADFDELRDVNHEEMQQGFLPELKESDLDISGYDIVFIGYPVWATTVPQAVLSFLDEYDLSGKTVIPFCTHDGYGAGRSYQVIAEASHAAVALDGIAIEAKDVPDAGDTVSAWLADIGISGLQEQDTAAGETAIRITIGDVTLGGVLYDTALAEEIKAYFPLTISMSGYGGREYYGGVDFYPENLEGGRKNFENGDITYCEAHHNMAIFYAQTDHPDFSVEVIPIGRVTSDLSVFEDLDGRQEITFSLSE